MSPKNLLIPFAAILLLAGCTDTVPVSAITPQGAILKGTTTLIPAWYPFAVPSKSFQVAGSNLSCSGSATSRTLDNIPISCSDGRKGVAAFTSTDHGVITLNDGSTAQFVTGDAASAF